MQFSCKFILFIALGYLPGYTCENQFVKSNKVINIGHNVHLMKRDGNGNGRTKRELPSTAEAQRYLDKHNALRRLPTASNMNILTWNAELAEMASLWAEECVWEHGQPDYSDPPYSSIGQNLWATSGSSFNIESVVQAWYNEEAFYHLDTNTCDANRVCGHYTQVVWDVTSEVGCAAAQCDPIDGLTSSGGIIVVCNYGPPGNYPRGPYTEGAPCTQCDSDVFWCNDGLCDGGCSGPSADCECAADCRNCGTLQTDTCTCTCTPGWTAGDCSEECADTHVNCGASPGWPPFTCTEEYSYVLSNCPAMCGLCETADESTADCDETDPPQEPTERAATDPSGATEENVVVSLRITSVTYTDTLADAASPAYQQLYSDLLRIFQNICPYSEITRMEFHSGSVVADLDMITDTPAEDVEQDIVQGIQSGDFEEYIVDPGSVSVEEADENSGACFTQALSISLAPSLLSTLLLRY